MSGTGTISGPPYGGSITLPSSTFVSSDVRWVVQTSALLHRRPCVTLGLTAPARPRASSISRLCTSPSRRSRRRDLPDPAALASAPTLIFLDLVLDPDGFVQEFLFIGPVTSLSLRSGASRARAARCGRWPRSAPFGDAPPEVGAQLALRDLAAGGARQRVHHDQALGPPLARGAARREVRAQLVERRGSRRAAARRRRRRARRTPGRAARRRRRAPRPGAWRRPPRRPAR